MSYKKFLCIEKDNDDYVIVLWYSKNDCAPLKWYSRKDSAIKGANRLHKYFEDAEVVNAC